MTQQMRPRLAATPRAASASRMTSRRSGCTHRPVSTSSVETACNGMWPWRLRMQECCRGGHCVDTILSADSLVGLDVALAAATIGVGLCQRIQFVVTVDKPVNTLTEGLSGL